MIATQGLEIATLLLPAIILTGATKAAGGFAILEARSATNTTLLSNTLTVCVLYNSKYKRLPLDVQMKDFHHLIDFSYTDGCTPVFIHPIKSFVAVMRGNCSFIQKARVVQDAKGAAAIVVDYENSTQLNYPGGSESDFMTFNITLVTITHNDYMAVLNLSELVEVAVYASSGLIWDLNLIIIIVLPSILVFAGAAWAAYDEFHYTRRSALRTSKSHDHAEDHESNNSRRYDGPDISALGIFIWFTLICGFILLLYFFYDYVVYFLIAVFCISGGHSLYVCLHPLWSRVMPVTYLIPTNKLPCVRSKVKLKDLMLLMLCLSVSIYWAVKRHASYAWILQDLLGATLCVYCIRTLRLPNLKVIMVLLILLLIYDVFFVFVTPLFTSDGTSIMESVATSNRGRSKEPLPMVFLFPNLSESPFRKCLGKNFSVLGFGDVVVPGLLVAYNAVFDIKTGSGMVYFICSSVGYVTGMIVCIICLIYMKTGQPALLYLVPSTLVSTVFMALIRQEFLHLFCGHHQTLPTADDNIEPSNMDDLEARDLNDNGVNEEQRTLINEFLPYK
ncbi:hypothetical protein BsWGS_20685 [Bradybaena similaris]